MRAPVATFATGRLAAEPLGPAHLDEACRLFQDPAVMRTLSADGLPLPVDVTRRTLDDAAAHWSAHAFGLWAFREKEGGRFVGRGGLKVYRIDDADVIGLAYAVVSPLFGRGYATEMAAASLDVAFDRLGFDEVGSWTLPVNVASQRVMEKLGFRYEREFTFAGLPHRFYRLPAAAWRAGRSSTPPPALL